MSLSEQKQFISFADLAEHMKKLSNQRPIKDGDKVSIEGDPNEYIAKVIR